MSKRWSVVTTVAAVLTLAACDTGPSEPAGELSALDAALMVAQETQGHVESMREPGVPGLRFPGPRLPSLGGERPDCPVEGHRFRCPPTDQDGVTVVHEVQFFAADGSLQDALNDETFRVTFDMTMTGTGLAPRGGAGHGRHGRDLDVTDVSVDVRRERKLEATIEGDVVTWNGTGSSSSSHSFTIDGAAWGRISSSQSTIQNVVLPYPQTEGAWPLSGTVTQHHTFSGNGSGGLREGEVDAVATFDGTQFATVTVNGEQIIVDLTERGKRGFGGHAR